MSQYAKKRSMRVSQASRMSLANLLPHRSFSGKSASGSSRTMGAFSDLRCYKHSPRVGQRHTSIGQDLFQFEAEQWRNAFSSMGGLKKMGREAPKPFTVLNQAPYHCQGLASDFKVRYGELIKLQQPVFRHPKKLDRPQICNCITKEVLPVQNDKKLTDGIDPVSLNESNPKMPVKYYLPKSCVVVRWDPLTYSNVDKICEWLVSSFGAFLFTTRTDSNSMLVAFETMEQARRAVQFPLLPRAKIRIYWHDIAMYNCGHYLKYKNYSVATDPIWKRGMEEKSKARAGRITQTTEESHQPKPKQLRITTSSATY